MDTEQVWRFRTKQFLIVLEITPDYNYQYDGEDPDGEIQLGIDRGDLTAFHSRVVVYFQGTSLRPVEVGSDSLCGSVYHWEDRQDFWQQHRTEPWEGRNCGAYRAVHGSNARVCHYFPSMVHEAVRDARINLRRYQQVKVR